MATQAKAGTTKPAGVPESTHPVTDKVQDTLHASVDKFAMMFMAHLVRNKLP